MGNGSGRSCRVLGLLAGGALLAAVSAGCAAFQAPSTGPEPAAAAERPPADTVPDEVVAEAAEDQGLDPELVVEQKREAERRVEELDPEKEREFRALFGPDPLGLARFPENASRYEIPLEMNEQVEAWVDYFQNVVPERFALYLARKGRYEGMIRQKLRLAGLPQDLLYLALIESGMNPNAYSRAHAVGLWQFIRSTGQMYGLRADHWVDDRRDPIKATDAAIAHLSDLFDEFGSWYLAAAAYNAGAGRIRRGLAATGTDNFWDLASGRTLRAETRNYVPKLLAAAIIGADPERYGFTDIEAEPSLAFEEVEVPDATSLDVIAEAAGTDEETIKAMNPQFVRAVTPPDRRVTVRVPRGSGERFAAAYERIPPERRVSWLTHSVTRGETLSRIAARYGTSVAELRAANNNVNPRRLQIGQTLIVRRASGGAAVASRERSRAAEEARRRGPVTVVVRRGDTLWSIARRHGVTTRQLIAWNDLGSTLIRPGDRLTIRN